MDNQLDTHNSNSSQTAHQSGYNQRQTKTPTQSPGGTHHPLKKRSLVDTFRITKNRVFPPHIYGFFLAALHLIFSFVVSAFALTFVNSNVGLNGGFLPRNMVMIGIVVVPMAASAFVFISATMLFSNLQKRFGWIMKDDERKRANEKHYVTNPAI